MSERKQIDLRQALNAISDVVMNRPRPLREFDQIYMKTGDMVMQSEIVANWSEDKRLAFIGDGDAISVCTAYLKSKEIIDFGPTRIKVFDFDERIVQAINRFADKERIEHLSAQLYNCLDAFPDDELGKYDFFYTNPPWGASNNGESVNVFMQRGMESTGYQGSGMVVIADDDELDWPKQVLGSAQKFAASAGYFVSRMMPKMHLYHLDDAPDLHSCNLIVSALPGDIRVGKSETISDIARLAHFYGRSKAPRVKYVREIKRLDYGKANESEYRLEMLEAKVE